MRSMSDPNNPLGWTNPTSPNNPNGWTNPFSPNNPNGFTNPSSPNNPNGWTNPFSPNNPYGLTNPFSPNNPLRHGRLIQPSMKKSGERRVSPTGWSSHRSGRAKGSLVVVARLAVFALVLVHVLPHVLRPTPPEILSARQFVTSFVESAGGLAPPDVARSIEAFIRSISR